MHAASVHPEPGSNSLKNYILNLSLLRLNTFFRANSILSFILLFEFLNVFINENLHCLKSLDLKPSASNFLLFNFQWASAVSRESAYLLYYNLFQLSSVFSIFFRFFYHFSFLAKTDDLWTMILCIIAIYLCWKMYLLIFAKGYWQYKASVI